MFGAIKRRIQEGNQQRELQRQEATRQRGLARKREEEQERQQRELQEKVLAMLQEGKVPDLHLNISVPFRLLKNERWILAIDGVSYAEMRTKRVIHGRSAGTSVRVMKGVSMRAGASRGTPVETDELTNRGTGTFAVSTKHVFFHGERSFRIPLAKIVSVQHMTGDTVEIVRDRASAQPEYFGIGSQNADFIVQLLHLLPAVDLRRGAPDVQPIESYGLPIGDIGADDMLDYD
jgi:hypothetical protein